MASVTLVKYAIQHHHCAHSLVSNLRTYNISELLNQERNDN